MSYLLWKPRRVEKFVLRQNNSGPFWMKMHLPRRFFFEVEGRRGFESGLNDNAVFDAGVKFPLSQPSIPQERCENYSQSAER